MKAERNPQRYNNYWEPIYNPSIKPFIVWEQNVEILEHSTGLKNVRFDIKVCNNVKSKRLNDNVFENVDFVGELDGEQLKFTFRKCKFNYCSFRDTKLKNVKFTDCTFDHTTFTFGSFRNCEFRNCTFTKLGVSSNATFLDNIYVDPASFLNDFYLVSDKALLKEKNRNWLYQWSMLEKTKSHIARSLANMPLIRTNIDFHISSIKTSRKHEILSWIKRSIYLLIKGSWGIQIKSFFNLVYYLFEYPTIMFFGWLSGWGNKIGKTISIGALTLLVLSFINYGLIFSNETFKDSLLRTTEYWLLFGYTKYSFETIPHAYQWIIFLDSVLGMIWFASLIPIIINKLGRNDE